MAKRKSKKPQLEDATVLLDTPVVKAKRRINSYVSPALLCIIALTLGASILGWFCMQQQQSIDRMSESFTTMQQRVTNFQRAMEMTNQQDDDDLSVEERIFALEEAQKQAQEEAEAALATSEKVKNSDLFPQLVALHTEMNTRWDEMKQAALSVTTLQGMFKNKSDELDVMKEKVVAGLSSNSALSDTVDGLNTAFSKVIERATSTDALNAQLEAQASLLNELKDLLYVHSLALHAHNQEMAAIKKTVKAKQVMRAQALEEMLSLVRMTLDEQFFTSQHLHSSVLAQLQTFETQLVNGPSWPIKQKTDEEDTPPELISPTTQSASEEQETLEEIQDQAEEEVVEDETEEQAEEETVEEEQPAEPDVEADDAEEEEMDVTDEEEKMTPEDNVEVEMTPDDEEEGITEQSEEQEDSDVRAEEEIAKETIEDHILEESSEEEVAEEAVEDWDSSEEEND